MREIKESVLFEESEGAIEGINLIVAPLKQHLESLYSERKKLLEEIESKRKAWKTFTQQAQDISSKILEIGSPYFAEIDRLDREIHELFEQILSRKKLGKRKRNKILSVYGLLLFEEYIYPPKNPKYLEIFYKPSSQNQSNNKKVGVDELKNLSEDSGVDPKSLRNIFLRLAEIFHPDRTQNKDRLSYHSEVMKELNRAYQDKDIARLIEIERQHGSGQLIEIDPEDRADLKAHIELLEQQNKMLAEQNELLSKELETFENTIGGELLKKYTQSTEDGIDPFVAMCESAARKICHLNATRDFVQLFRAKKISLLEFENGPDREFVEQYFPIKNDFIPFF